MGLKEKRAVKAYQDNTYPSWISKIEEAASTSIEVEVDWEKLAVEGFDHNYEEAFTKVYFKPVVKAFSDITVDDMGEEALAETVQKIMVTNTAGNYSPASAYRLANGTLTIDHASDTNIDDVDERADYLTDYLMKQM